VSGIPMALPNNRKNDKAAIAERRQKVAALYVEGHTQWAIAKTLNIAQGTVSKDLQVILEEWKARSVEDYADRLAVELAKLDAAEAEAWEAWEKSKQDREATSERTERARQLLPDPNARPDRRGNHPRVPQMVTVRTTTNRTRKGQVGDPRFLDQVTKCVETRLRLMGALKPASVNVTQQVATGFDWDALTDAMARPVPDRIAEMLNEAIDPPLQLGHFTNGAETNGNGNKGGGE
jgi:hypothetical protein